MNNFLEYAPPKSQPSQKVRLARICFTEFRQDSGAGHGATFMPETESPYKSQTGGAGFMTRPIKRKWGKVLPDNFKPGRGG
ncbi:hypothetical protein [Candidatus Avelusimicrobium faecicola]|uniref:hypothetical protein n=1 Tax=Candidatus Avelusimicrobium faecicola TaxID=3416205 RepID=UPI0015A36A99